MMDRASLEPWAATDLIGMLDAAGYAIVPKAASAHTGIERLEAEAKEAGEHEVRACAERDQYLESNVKLAAALRQDRKRIERLKAALQPLAKLPLWRDKYNNGTDDLNTGGAVKFYFTVDDVRKARAALGD